MAKFLKVWDMTKEGKGVKKDEPRKKPFFAFFEEYFRHFSKLLTAGLLWIPFVVLIIPSGLGNVGMYGVTRSLSLQRPCFVTSDFFDYIKKNWKHSLKINKKCLICMVSLKSPVLADIFIVLALN